MILVDTNLLVYAWDRSFPEHEAAVDWLQDRLSGTPRVGIPWQSSMGFLRLVTNSRIFPGAASVSTAWKELSAWLSCPCVWTPEAGPIHRHILGGLLENLGGGSKLIPDAHLAALAIEHGLTLCSSDGDFARFDGLRWLNPLKK